MEIQLKASNRTGFCKTIFNAVLSMTTVWSLKESPSADADERKQHGLNRRLSRFSLRGEEGNTGCCVLAMCGDVADLFLTVHIIV